MIGSRLWLVLCVAWCVQALTLKSRDTKDLKAQYLVATLPGLYSNIPADEIPLMFAGQLKLYESNDTHYFFWKYSDNKAPPNYRNRTVFWLNGGPGCSSMDGALMEAGPFRVNKERKITYNPGSWHKMADMVFVDQPANVGFSYSNEYDSELDQVKWHFLRFLEKYYEVFPEDREKDIYIAGESYAGQYIPYIAAGILEFNKNAEKPYNLKGLLIGNGWIAPDIQSLSYVPYGLAAGILDKTNPQFSSVLHQHETCQNALNGADPNNHLQILEVVNSKCEVILNKLLSATRDRSGPADQQCYNMYDYTLKDYYPACGSNWPPDLVDVGPFLNQKHVQAELNIEKHVIWHECDGAVGRKFGAHKSAPAIDLLPGILGEIPVVLFNGNRDIICNYIGTENFIKEMKWNGETGFTSNQVYEWMFGSEHSGYIKTERNLTFVNVFDSSHMVPFDKPEISRSLLDLITRDYDLGKHTFEDGEKDIIQTYPLGKRPEVSEPDTSHSDSNSDAEHATVSNKIAPSNVPTQSQDDEEAKTSVSATASAVPLPEGSSAAAVTRVIQLVVIVVLIWGIYMLYSTYKSRPTSIIKSGPSGRKKNVQWADQLRQFQEDDEGLKAEQPGFFSRVYNKLRGDRNAYAPVYEDIELAEEFEPDVENFVIDSDDEQTPRPSSPSLT